MNNSKCMKAERNRLHKMINFRLPHKFMNIGFAIVIGAVITMFVRAFAMEGDHLIIKEAAKKAMLVGLLIMSISRDREEDELTDRLRMASYALAFVIGVIYALIMPFIEFGVDSVVSENGETIKDLGDFQVLIFMLMIQLMFYHNLKRYR